METLYDIYLDVEKNEYSIIIDENFAEKILVDNQKETNECEWEIVELENSMDNLIQRIAENNKDKQIMLKDLKYLMLLEDTYIFSSTTTNEYIAKSDNKEKFNKLCKDFITYKKIENE